MNNPKYLLTKSLLRLSIIQKVGNSRNVFELSLSPAVSMESYDLGVSSIGGLFFNKLIRLNYSSLLLLLRFSPLDLVDKSDEGGLMCSTNLIE